MKKITNWLFRESLELHKHWFHRLIKVVFLSIFFLVSIASYIAIIYSPERELLSKHNIVIKNTLYQFTKNYGGEDNKNTIPLFFEQKDEFGILSNNKIDYISLYQLEKSFCLKEPSKYTEAISKILHNDYIAGLSYGQKPNNTIEDVKKLIEDNLIEDPTRKCYFLNLNEDLKGTGNLSNDVINYKPSVIFYIEATILIPIIAFISFLMFTLIYYHLFLYIIYGSKK